MAKRGHRIATEVKDNIINRIKNEGVTVLQAAKEHGIAEGTIYQWLSKKVEGSVSMGEFLKLQRDKDNLLKLVGEMTLKLSEPQKKKY